MFDSVQSLIRKFLDMRSTEDGPPSTLPGLWKYPSFRDEPLKSGTLWLEGKRKDDGAEGLWRIHDELYDFSPWIHNHPGGSDWLLLTKGTDITEAFEAHHIALTAERLLPHFHVRKATTTRNSPYTFKDDGFFRTLKRRAREVLKDIPKGPSTHSKVTTDALLASALVTAVLAAANASLALATLSGVLFTLTIVCAHNFFHQKDNLRMYYFDLSLMSSREWRVSHALSHHLFPNSILDLEISMFEPVLQYLPKSDKTWWARYGPWIYSPAVYSLGFFSQFIIRAILSIKGMNGGPRKQDAIPLIIPLLMLTYSSCGLSTALSMWLWITIVSSFTFGLIGLNAAHHHPEIFHDGDTPRDNLDWGVQQLDAVRDRPWVSSYPFLALTTFGHHGLHHLFPTVDHGHLDALVPIVEKTCEEFGIIYEPSSVVDLFKGQFQQCARNQPNPIPHGKGRH